MILFVTVIGVGLVGTLTILVDIDGDGLNTIEEINHGTELLNADSDGDLLIDGEEVAGRTTDGAKLPNSSPLRMDLYLQVNYAKGVKPLTDAEIQWLVDSWAEMSIRNPDGSTGVTLHVDDTPPYGGETPENITYYYSNFTELDNQMDEDKLDHFQNFYDNSEYMPSSRRCEYHQVLFVNTNSSKFINGKANALFMFVTGGTTNEPGYVHRTPHNRSFVLIHELLHNALEDLDPKNRAKDSEHSVYSGYYADKPSERQAHLPRELGREIERDGFGTFEEWYDECHQSN